MDSWYRNSVIVHATATTPMGPFQRKEQLLPAFAHEPVVVALPPVLLAVTVNVVAEVTAVGVPEMAPVEVEKERPDGRVAEIDQEVTAPPLDVGVTVVMAVFLVNVSVLGL